MIFAFSPVIFASAIDAASLFDFIECFMTTFLRAQSWLNWVDEDDDEVGLKEKPEDITSK